MKAQTNLHFSWSIKTDDPVNTVAVSNLDDNPHSASIQTAITEPHDEGHTELILSKEEMLHLGAMLIHFAEQYLDDLP